MFTFFTSRPSLFSGGKISSIGQIFQFCKYSKLGVELPTVIFHWKWGVPFSQFFHMPVSDSPGTQFLQRVICLWNCRIISIWIGWIFILRWNYPLICNCEDCTFSGAWWFISPLKKPTTWGLWKICKALSTFAPRQSNIGHGMSIVLNTVKFIFGNHQCSWFHISFIVTLYYKIRQVLAQNAMILLQNSTKIYYKMRELFYYKMRQVLQNAMILLQNATVITKSDVYYKICLYT